MNIGVILAGGIGSRMGSDKPKQYLLANGKPIISYVMDIFQAHDEIGRIVIVADEAWRGYIAEWTDKGAVTKQIDYAPPGRTRQHSIYNALKCAASFAQEEDIVLIHDAARPNVPNQVISECIRGAKEKGGAMPVLPMKDTVYRSADGETITELLVRSELVAGQAPEAFRFGEYYRIHNAVDDDEIARTVGSSQIAFCHGMQIKLVKGSELNFKITGPEDLRRFEQLVKEQ